MPLVETRTLISLKNILFATDFSEYSQTALTVAANFARRHGAKLWVTHVEPGKPRLAIPIEAMPACFDDRFHAFARGSMYEVDGGTGRSREPNDSLEGEFLRQLGMNEMQVVTFAAAFGGEPFVVELYDLIVFGVHHHYAVVLSDFFHRELNAPRIEADRHALGMWWQDVGGEDLETREALLDHVGNLVKRFERGRAHESDVERVVNERITLPASATLFDRPGNFHRGFDETEIQVCSGASKSHSASVLFGAKGRSSAVGVGEIENIEMGMRLDAAGHHNFSRGIDRSASLRRGIVEADVSDLFAANTDRPTPNSLRRYDLAVADQQIQHGLWPPDAEAESVL